MKVCIVYFFALLLLKLELERVSRGRFAKSDARHFEIYIFFVKCKGETKELFLFPLISGATLPALIGKMKSGDW